MSEDIKKEQASVRSFRVTDDVMMRFRKLQDDLKLTQDGALKMLVDAYELENAKNAIPDRETEIENFQTKASELVEAFIHSLQLNQDAEARIRNEVALKLESKDKLIVNLQEKLDANKDEIKGLKEHLLSAEGFAAEAAKKLKVAEQTASDKVAIADMLQGKLAEAEQKSAGYDALKASESSLRRKVEELMQELKDAKKDAEIAQERALTELEREKDKRISELEIAVSKAETLAAEKSVQIEKMEKQHQIDLEKLDAVREDRYLLKEQIAELNAQIKILQK